MEHRLTKREKRELRKQEKEEIKQKNRSKRFKKRIYKWITVIIILGLIIFGITEFVSSVSNNDNGGQAITVSSITDFDWVKGNKNASTALIEYSDFQCPACGFYYTMTKKLTSEFSNKVAFVYRHFPLSSIHKNANLAARASEASGKQRKFWEMHNILFENQKEWSENINAYDIFVGYAKKLGLDIKEFKNDIDSDEIENKVDESYKNAVSIGLNSTPTFFLNGKKIKNSKTYNEFKSIIEQSINSKK